MMQYTFLEVLRSSFLCHNQSLCMALAARSHIEIPEFEYNNPETWNVNNMEAQNEKDRKISWLEFKKKK